MNLSRLVYLGAGARDGDRRAGLASAIRLLEANGVAVEKVSSLYETQPVDLPGDRPLLNGAIQIVSDLPPAGLLAACLSVEEALGRRRTPGREGLRPVDLDILLYGDLVVDSPRLVIPHPRLHLRRFVLEPLAEIAPKAMHPVLGVEIDALLHACADAAWVRFAEPASAWLAR